MDHVTQADEIVAAYPQCFNCSRQQGLDVASELRKESMIEPVRLSPPDKDVGAIDRSPNPATGKPKSEEKATKASEQVRYYETKQKK